MKSLCFFYEFILRYLKDYTKNYWFLEPEEAVASQLNHLAIEYREYNGKVSFNWKKKN
jgi:hypothetical protein